MNNHVGRVSDSVTRQEAVTRGYRMNSALVPNEWKTIPLRYVCKLNPSVDFSGLEEDDELVFLPMDKVKSGYFIPNTDKFSKYASSYNAFEDGDILLAKVTPCFENGNIAVVENLGSGKGFGSSELFVIRPTNVDRKFLFYYFQSSAFKQQGEASMTGAGGLKRVSPDLLRQHHLPVPEVKTQRLIANYLDRETARIDALVTDKEKMLALLEEKRAALISRAVTRGLNPDAPLKPSGLDWLGDIPAHWKTKKVKHIASLNSGETITADSISDVGGYPVYGGNGFRGFTSEYTHIGDYVLIGRQGALCGNINYASGQFWASEHAVVVAINGNNDVFWLGQLLRFMNLNQYSQSAAQPGISVEVVENLKIPVPPIPEQIQIAVYMKKESDHIDAIREEVAKTTILLIERRAALITAAVTGQIPIEAMCP